MSREAFKELLEQYKEFEDDCIEQGYNPPINMEFYLESSLIHKLREEDADRQSRFRELIEKLEEWSHGYEIIGDVLPELRALACIEPDTPEVVEYASLPLGYISDNVGDWDGFCRTVGLNEWCLAEGLANRDELYRVPISVLKKYGIMK